jgi:hypothetical protein
MMAGAMGKGQIRNLLIGLPSLPIAGKTDGIPSGTFTPSIDKPLAPIGK